MGNFGRKIGDATHNTSVVGTEKIPQDANKYLTPADLQTYMAPVYIVTANASSFSPADATTYYFGAFHLAPGTTADKKRFYFPKAGTLYKARISVYNDGGTQGTNETSTMNFRLNNTTDTALTTLFDANDASGSSSFFSITGLAVTIAVDDYGEIKWLTPTFSTNPTNVVIQVDLFVKTG